MSSNGPYRVLDKRTQVTWQSNPHAKRVGSASVRLKERSLQLSLHRFEVHKEGDKEIKMRHKLAKEGVELTVSVRLSQLASSSRSPSQGGTTSSTMNLYCSPSEAWTENASKKIRVFHGFGQQKLKLR
ncbi:MAG: hypothetical protein OEZ48_10540 [Candidatus Bathyarchaeota archaeon]|nr:hypothetical protein [Candidatus Bathyarchaeota archaeon]MDH5688282.1 hypothetical protein [Candidatus Bathyarchaeota archaeon]